MSLTKLTLSVDKKIIALAKEQARQDGISVSAMFSGFVRARSQRKKEKPTTPGPLTRQALDIGRKASRSTARKSDKELIGKALTEKYGID